MDTHDFFVRLLGWIKDNHPEVILDAMEAVFHEEKKQEEKVT